MNDPPVPSREEFLAAPLAEIARVAPATMIYVPAGTRRAAALAGVPADGHAYARWSRARMIACLDLLFQHGVQHLFTLLITPSQMQEVGPYREQLLAWTEWGTGGPEALADYARLGWRVRLIGAASLPALQPLAERLRALTPGPGPRTVWFSVVPTPEAPLLEVLAAARTAAAGTPAAVMQALYGETVPAAGLFLSFGKPIISADLVPPLLLTGPLHCYWSQRPGYELDAAELRAILYDYAYLRPTWRADKSGRAGAALAHRTAWEQGPVLGLGQRLGPYWYPAPIPPPPPE